MVKFFNKNKVTKLKEKVGIRCLNLFKFMTSNGYTEAESQIYDLKEMLAYNSIDIDKEKNYSVYKFYEEIQESFAKNKPSIN